MTVIVKADIITDVNENLETSFAATATNLDRAIIKTLTDMSNRGLLIGTDSAQTLVDGDLTLNFPTGFRSNGVINITLTDTTSGNNLRPLISLPGGHNEYRKLRSNDSATGRPEWYSEFNGKFHLWRPSNAAYTTLIEYIKNHAKSAGAIEFTTEFENLMFAGTTYHHALATNRRRALELWAPVYAGEMKTAVFNRDDQPAIARG